MLRPLIIAWPNKEGTGGQRRSFEILLRAKEHGIDPFIIIDISLGKIPSEYIKLLSEKYKVYVVGHKSLKIPSGIRFYINVMSTFKILKEIIKSIDHEDIDIIVSHDEIPHHILMASAIAKLIKKPWTVIVQSFFYIDPFLRKDQLTLRIKYTIGCLHRFLRISRVLNILNDTKTICVSPAIPYEMKRRGFPLKDYLILNTPLGINHELIRSIHPVDESYDGVYVSSLLSAEKGFFDLLKVWSIIVNKIQNAKLCILGKAKGDILRLIYNDPKITRNITYLGFITGIKKYSLIKSSKVFVYPSMIDAFPTVILEALACGTPVVCYNVPAMSVFKTKAVIKVKAGDVRSMANKVLELIVDEELRKELSIEARRYAAKFTWDKAVIDEKKCYMNIIESYYLKQRGKDL